MPRKLRVPSPSGIYHVMLRGINRDDIFLDDIDFLKMEKILRSLAKPVDKEGNPKPPICKIFAYCLMTNHIHLLIAELDESISDTIKRLGVAYASYFNKRRGRSGPLFEGRFRSEPVDEADYFITLLHYIHYNPVKAGMVKRPGWYKWSSWHEYELPDDTYNRGICEQDIPFDNLNRTQVAEIVLDAKDPISFISPVDIESVDDDEAEKIIKSLVPEEYRHVELTKLPKVVKLTITNKAKGYGLKNWQITRILGVSKHFIYKGRTKLTRTIK